MAERLKEEKIEDMAADFIESEHGASCRAAKNVRVGVALSVKSLLVSEVWF